MSQVQQAMEEILRLTDRITEQVAGLPEEVARWKPSDEAWSIMEVLCHVEEAVPYWLWELKRVIDAPGAEWGRGLQDEVRLAAVSRADQRSLQDVVQGIRETKQAVTEILGSLRDEDLAVEAPSRNPRFGTKPMAFVVQHLLVEHLQTHLNQIMRNLRQHGETA